MPNHNSQADLPQEAVYKLIDADNCAEAFRMIQEYRSQAFGCPEFTLYEALCFYDEKNDLECLRKCLSFISDNPTHSKKNYALFTIAMSLCNVGLEEEALSILQSLPASYPDRDREIHKLEATLKVREEVRSVLKAIKG